MSRNLRVACPVCIILVIACVILGLSANTRAASGGQDVEQNVMVTYTADSWSNSGIAAVATAQETSASAQQDVKEPEVDQYSTTVPPQEHRDSGLVLSDEDRMKIERVVMCEAGGEGERGQMMVAQCILEGMLRYDFTLDEYIRYYSVMSTSYDNVTDEVRNSVSRVFDNGERVIEDKVDLWYNPALVNSSWHEEQEYVITVGNHRFFWMIDNNNA